MTVSAKTRELLSRSPSSAPLGLFILASIGLGLYLSIAKIFYIYLIN